MPAQVGGTAVFRLDLDLLDLVDLLEVLIVLLSATFPVLGIETQGPVTLPLELKQISMSESASDGWRRRLNSSVSFPVSYLPIDIICLRLFLSAFRNSSSIFPFWICSSDQLSTRLSMSSRNMVLRSLDVVEVSGLTAWRSISSRRSISDDAVELGEASTQTCWEDAGKGENILVMGAYLPVSQIA